MQHTKLDAKAAPDEFKFCVIDGKKVVAIRV
jgi:hypothetical protein